MLHTVPESVGMSECLVLLSELLDVDLAFTADTVVAGGREVIQRPEMGVPVVFRELYFSGAEPILVPRGVDIERDAVLTTPEAAIFSPEVMNPRSLLDFDQLRELKDVLVLGFVDPVSGDPMVRLVVADSGGEVTAAGACTGLLQYVASGLAAEMGYVGSAGTVDFLTDWVAAGPAERAQYAAAEAAWLEAQDLRVAWVDEDPRIRNVRPELIPEEMLGGLDVRAAVVDLEADWSKPRAVVFLSDEGGGLSVMVGSDRGVLPFYYFPELSDEIRILVIDPSSLNEPETVGDHIPAAVVSVGDLEQAGGVLVEGTIDEPRIRLLSWAEVAEEMGVSEAELARRRTELLTP